MWQRVNHTHWAQNPKWTLGVESQNPFGTFIITHTTTITSISIISHVNICIPLPRHVQPMPTTLHNSPFVVFSHSQACSVSPAKCQNKLKLIREQINISHSNVVYIITKQNTYLKGDWNSWTERRYGNRVGCTMVLMML